jgi:Beta/Gamma crystallin
MRMFLLGCSAAFAPLVFALTAQAQPATEARPQAAIFLFSGEEFGGEVRQVFTALGGLPEIGFNDRARSVSVIEGQWELCENADFTGQCVFLREDVADLRVFGLSAAISSVRPIYEYTEASHGLLFSRDDKGAIRYADNQRYGDEAYRYGYNTRTRIETYHYGYSPQYSRAGYYSPAFGYDPYGFGYGRSNYYQHGHYYDPFRDDYRRTRTRYGARNGALTLFQHSNGNGVQLGLNGSIEDLRSYRLDDTLSSLRVREGQWEVCDGAYFSGTCRTVDASTGFLNLSGFNDRVSSIRRIDTGTVSPGGGHGGGYGGGRGRRGGAETVMDGPGTLQTPAPLPQVVADIPDLPPPPARPDYRRIGRDQGGFSPAVITPGDVDEVDDRPRRGGRGRPVRDLAIPDVPQDFGGSPPSSQPVFEPAQPPAYEPPPRYDPPPAFEPPPPRFDPPSPPAYDPPARPSPATEDVNRMID